MAVAENRPLSLCNSNYGPRCPQNPWASTLQTVLRISNDSSPKETNSNRCAAGLFTSPKPPVIRIANSAVDVKKLRNIIDYLQRPLDAHLLCPTHSACIEEALPKLRNSLQQRIRDLQAQSHRCYCCCCCGTAEDLIRSCTTAVQQINKCAECRCKFANIDDISGMRISVNRRSPLFRSSFKKRTESKTTRATDGTSTKGNRVTSSNCRELQTEVVDDSNKCVDKLDYCWQWLLHSAEVDSVTSNGFRCGMSNRTPPSPSTSDLSTTSDRRSKSAPPDDALSPGEQADLASVGDTTSDLYTGRSGYYIQFAPGMSYTMEECIFEDPEQYAVAFGRYEQYPCSVTRRPELRKCGPGFSTDRFPDKELENLHHIYCDSTRKPSSQTPWLTVRTENKFDSNLWTALSSMSLNASTTVPQEEQQQQQQPEQQRQRDLRTIQFLSSVSPNMQLRAPPNHNPFAKNESV